MKHILISFALLASSTFAMANAQKPCANYAKFGAIRVYKAEMGAVQGSEGIQHAAKLIGSQDDLFDYVVTISDNNDEGEAWEIDYAVRVEKQGSSCSVLTVKKIAEREL